MEIKATQHEAQMALGLAGYRPDDGRLEVYYFGKLVRNFDADEKDTVAAVAHLKQIESALNIIVNEKPLPELFAVTSWAAKFPIDPLEKLYMQYPDWFEVVRKTAEERISEMLYNPDKSL